MATRTRLVSPILISIFLAATGCAHKENTPSAMTTTTTRTTSAMAPRSSQVTATGAVAPKSSAGGNVFVSDEIARLCNIEFDNISKAPKFEFDQSALQPQDREVLSQVGKCLTTGPLKGRSLALIGRADPRGEVEYNMALGEHRAGSVRTYLMELGIPAEKLNETSRGKLDATGTDESGWQRDRRVDLILE